MSNNAQSRPMPNGSAPWPTFTPGGLPPAPGKNLGGGGSGDGGRDMQQNPDPREAVEVAIKAVTITYKSFDVPPPILANQWDFVETPKGKKYLPPGYPPPGHVEGTSDLFFRFFMGEPTKEFISRTFYHDLAFAWEAVQRAMAAFRQVHSVPYRFHYDPTNPYQYWVAHSRSDDGRTAVSIKLEDDRIVHWR